MTKMMVFHKPNNKVALPILTKNGTQIECSDNFNFLGIDLHKHELEITCTYYS